MNIKANTLYIHASACAWPIRKEYVCVFAPEEGHVRHHHLVVKLYVYTAVTDLYKPI